jgi:hypothetical protein
VTASCYAPSELGSSTAVPETPRVADLLIPEVRMPQGGAVPRDPEVTQARAERATAVRLYGADDPRAEQPKRRLEELKAAAHAAAIVAGWPELSDVQLDKIAGLLRAGGRQ